VGGCNWSLKGGQRRKRGGEKEERKGKGPSVGQQLLPICVHGHLNQPSVIDLWGLAPNMNMGR
jgi:hypothetical protein